MACVSTKDEVSWQEAGFSLDQKLWNTTNQDFIKFTASDLSREAEQIDRGFLVVSVSKGLSSQQSQPTLHRVEPSSSTRPHPAQSTNNSWNYTGGNKKHFFKTKEWNKTNRRKNLKKRKNQPTKQQQQQQNRGYFWLEVWGRVT